MSKKIFLRILQRNQINFSPFIVASISAAAVFLLLPSFLHAQETTPATADLSRVTQKLSVGSISKVGDYTEIYKIDLPPGRNNLTPDVSIVYSSQNKNYESEIGIGWNINIPFIERAAKQGVNNLYTAKDFNSSLDGELVEISTTTYRAKIEGGSFNTYEKSTSTWIVYDKLGTKYVFGSSTQDRLDNPTDSNQIFRWHISEIIDTNGNKISFSYIKTNNKVYLNKISYAHDPNGEGLYEVVFSYSSTTPYVHYKTGFPVKNENIVDNINVYFNDVLLRKYELDYQISLKSNFKLLSSIQKTGYDEAGIPSSQLPRTFQYTDHISGQNWVDDPVMASSTPKKLYSTLTSSGFSKNYYWRSNIIDMNGDGLVDWVSESSVYLNIGGSWETSPSWAALPVTNFNTEHRLADINGDGLPDIISSREDFFDNNNRVKVKNIKINQGDGSWSDDFVWAATIPGELQFRNFYGGYSEYNREVYFVDINGDGLSDWISNGNAYLNTGTGWSTTTSQTVPASSFVGSSRFADVNGDGLPDVVNAYRKEFHPVWNPNTPIVDYSVHLNHGNGAWTNSASWTASIPTYILREFQNAPGSNNAISTYSGRYLVDINGDNLTDWVGDSSVYLNTGNGWETSPSMTLPVDANNFDKDYRLVDLDGDNMTDIVRFYENSWFGTITNSKNALISNGLPLWLLATSTNEFGGTTTISYGVSTEKVGGTLLNPKNPISQNSVKNITYNPKIGQVITKSYEYSGGQLYYKSNDIFNRGFAGYHQVTEIDNLSKLKTFYHQGNTNSSSSNEISDEYAKIGKPYRVETTDLNNNLYQTIISRFATSSNNGSSTYVYQNQITNLTYDGDTDHYDTATSFDYDSANGNLLKLTEWGEVTAAQDGSFIDSGSDKRSTTYTYASNSALYILGLPSSERLDNSASTKIKETKYYYDNLTTGLVNKGNLTKKEEWATTTLYSNTQSAYNSYGLKTQDLDPRGNAINYLYDIYGLYPATTTNALNQSTKYTYDYSSGKIKTTTNPNGYGVETIYDGLDRILEVKEPKGTNGAIVVTLANSYSDYSELPYIHSQKFLDTSNAVSSYTYLDRLGRTIQERQETESSNQYQIRDYIFDKNNRIFRQSLPYFSNGSSYTSATNKNSLYSSFIYDALGRSIGIGTVLGTTSTAYDQNQITVIDALNNQKIQQNDSFNRLISLLEQNGTTTYITSYQWTPHSQLSRVTDALGNVRNFSYDGLGRRIRAEDLRSATDATFGVWTYVYDAAGNLGTTTNPKSQVTRMTYDALNRITTENFTGQAGTEGVYTYDVCTNGIGKMCSTKSLSATTTFSYNPAGLVMIEQKTINNIPFTQTISYDRQNNPIEVVYPDNSITRYTYNSAGKLERVEQKESTGIYRDIVSNYDYSPHGEITQIVYGNASETFRTYDQDELYRLRSIKTTATSTYGTGGPGSEFSIFETPLLEQDLAVGEVIVSEVTETLAASTSPVILENIEVSSTTNIFPTDEVIPQQIVHESSVGQNNIETTVTPMIIMTPKPGSTSTVEMIGPEDYSTSEEMVFSPSMMSMSGPTNGNPYTITIQPNATSGKDTFYGTVYNVNGQPDSEFMYIGGWGDWYYDYVEIPVTSLPDASLISSVKFKVFNLTTTGLTNNARVERITQPWTESSVTKTNNPTATSTGIPWTTMPGNSWIEFDITNIVKDWKNGLYPNYGLKISGQYNSGSYNKAFYASEYADATYRPRYEAIVYSNPPQPPTALLTNSASNPTTTAGSVINFSAIYNDQNSADTAMSYQLQVATSTDFTNNIWDSEKQSSSPLAPGTRSENIVYQGPTSLSTSTSYFWRIKFWDNHDTEGEWSTEIASFSVVPQFVSAPVGNFIQDLTYTYDSVGNIIKIVDRSVLGAAATTTYQYDSLYRLVRASTTESVGAPFLETYAYNALGNLINKSNSGSYVYQGNTGSNYANPHAPTNINGITYTYDRNGNLATTSAGLNNTWDYRNRLTNTVTSGVTTAYTYDVNEQRVTKTTGGVTTRYPSIGYEVAGAITTKHVYAGDVLLASITTTASSVPKTAYTHPDHLGSTHLVTNDLGTTTNLHTYLPYGSTRYATSTTSFIPTNQYIGQDRDNSSDLSYLNARYYRTNNGQFLSQDPVFWEVGQTKDGIIALHNPQAQNSYSYAGNNPVINIDPDGRWFKDFLTGKQSYTDFKTEIGVATLYMTQNSPSWNWAVNNPKKAGLAVGVTSAATAVPASAAVANLATIKAGAGIGYVGKMSVGATMYGYIAKNSLQSVPEMTTAYSQFKTNDISTWKAPIYKTATLYGPGSLNPHAGAVYDLYDSILNLAKDLGLKGYNNKVSNQRSVTKKEK